MNNKCNIVCKFYSPFFQSGCRLGTYCDYKHLNLHDYAKYSERRNNKNPLNLTSKSLLQIAARYISNHQYKAAVVILDKLLPKYPFNERLNEMMAKCLDKLDINRAHKYHSKLIDMKHTKPKHHINYANFLYRKKKNQDLKNASFHFGTALELIDNHSDPITVSLTHGFYAKFLHETNSNDIEEINNHFQIALNFNDYDPRLHYNYALFLMNNKKYIDAEEHFQKAMNMSHSQNGVIPRYYYFQYALCLKDMKQNEAANRYFKKALKLKKSEIKHVYGQFLCEVYKRYEEGIRYLKESYQENRNSQEYRDIYHFWRNTYDSLQAVKAEVEDKKDPEQYETETYQHIKQCPSSENEFRRFLGKIYCDTAIMERYYLLFEERELNDIKFMAIVDESDLDFIESTVHKRMFFKKIERFKKYCEKFDSWLEDIDMTEYGDKFEKVGILTFESFYFYIQNENDLLSIIGEENVADVHIIWNATPKMSRSAN